MFLRKTFSILLITILTLQVSMGSVFAQEADLDEPVLMQENFQLWISEILIDQNDVLYEQIGSKTVILAKEGVSAEYNYPFEVLDRPDLPYFRLDINSSIESDSVYYIRNTDSGEIWRTRAFSRNIFSLPGGNYEISFGNLGSDEVTFALVQTEFPFIGRVACLDPNMSYDWALLETYMRQGGRILSYGNGSVTSGTNIITMVVDTSELDEVLYSLESEEVEVLDFSFVSGVYEPLDILDNTTMSEGKFLSAYLPYDRGGLIVVSQTIMTESRESIEDFLITVQERVYQESTEFHELTEAINKYNGVFVAFIAVLSLVIFWSVFDEQFKEALDHVRGMNLREFLSQLNIKTLGKIPRKKDGWSSFIRKLAIFFVIVLFLGLVTVRIYQRRALPIPVLDFLDNLNLWFDSIGFEYLFSYILLFVLLIEVILVVTLLKNIVTNIRKLRTYSELSTRFERFSERIRFVGSIKEVLKISVVIFSVTYLAIQVLGYLGIYPTSYEYVLSNNDIGSIDDYYINDNLNEEATYLVLDTYANYKEATVEVEADINAPSEVYLSVASGDLSQTLLYSPEFDLAFTGISGDYRYFTIDEHRLELTNGVRDFVERYLSLGIDRVSIENSFIPSAEPSDTLSWADFIKSSDELHSEPVNNAENFEYSFEGLVGQFEMYTIILDGNISLSIDYTFENRDGGIPGLFVAIFDGDNNLVGIEFVEGGIPPIGAVAQNNLYIERSELEAGVVRVVIGYDQKEVLIDDQIGDLDRKISIDKITLNSDKLVFRPISSRWAMMGEQSMYVMKNENELLVNTMLKDGFNKVEYPETETFETPEHRIGLIQLSPTGGNIVESFYSLYSVDLDSYFNPFVTPITEIDSENEVILSKELELIEGVSMAKPLKIGLFTSDGQRFILSQPITVRVTKN